MATVVNDLVTKFSFEGSTQPLTEYNAALGGSIKLLAGMVASLAAVSAAFNAWADGILGGIDSLDALSARTRVSVAAIQELNFVAGQTQSTAGAMQSTLEGLSRTIGEAALKGSEDFARLGISVRDSNGQIKTADRVLDDVRKRFVSLGLSISEQEFFASSLGIDASLLQMLGKTNSEMAGLRDRAQELGTLTEAQAEQAAAYKRALNGLWFGLNSVKQLVAIGVAPELERLAGWFTDLIAENKDWIVNGLQVTVEWVGKILDAFKRLAPVLAVLAAGFVGAKIAVLGFSGVIAIIAAPVVLVTAAVVAALLAIDDLIVAFRDGKSVIADFFQDTFNVDIVENMTKAFRAFKSAVAAVADVLSGMWDAFVWGGKQAQAILTSVLDLFGSGDDVPAPAIARQLFAPGDDVPAPAIARQLFAPGDDVPAPQMTLPASPGVPSTTIDNRQINQSNTITVSAPDPQTAADAIGDRLQRQLDNANIQLAPGGR